MPKIKCICKNCGKVTERFPSQKTDFCNRRCTMLGTKPRHTKPHTEEAKEKMRKNYSDSSKETQFKKGHETIKGVEKGWFDKGSKPWNYQGGKRTLSQKMKDDVRYKKWREKFNN